MKKRTSALTPIQRAARIRMVIRTGNQMGIRTNMERHMDMRIYTDTQIHTDMRTRTIIRMGTHMIIRMIAHTDIRTRTRMGTAIIITASAAIIMAARATARGWRSRWRSPPALWCWNSSAAC